MIDWQAAARVLVNESESRASDFGGAAQAGDESFHKLCFARAEFPGERNDVSRIDLMRKVSTKVFSVVRAIGNERSHRAICDLGFWIFD